MKAMPRFMASLILPIFTAAHQLIVPVSLDTRPENFHERGLAGAILTTKPEDLAFPNLEMNVI